MPTVQRAAQDAPALPRPLEADLTILTRDGRVPDAVEPDALRVSLDGTPRRVLFVRRLGRGPGARATRAASRDARAGDAASGRSVVLAIDVRGRREDVAGRAEAAAGLLDRLGLGDRVAVVALPAGETPALAWHDDPPAARDALARVSRSAPSPGTVEGTRLLTSLQSLVTRLGEESGRKLVAVFGDGVGPLPADALGRFTASSASARVRVAAVTREASTATAGDRGDGLAQIASATGGPSARVGRRVAGRDLDRVATELSATFVAGFERLPTDAPGDQHALRVEMVRRDLTVSGPARWVMHEGPPVVAASVAPRPAPPAPPAATVSMPARGGRGQTPEEATGDLAVALDRIADYVEAYERLASVLVADEDYRQWTPQQQVRLRSDLLMVSPPASGEWVSFRDVYEVDGTAVREREDRLRRLFLDAPPGARARLQAIKTESARYNIGPFDRDINVPYLALKFVRPATIGRLRFELRGRREEDGLALWRVEFEEAARPTIIRDRARQDVPASGWYLVDRITGAIVESGLVVSAPAYEVQLVVRYRRDPALGLWVPARMEETYKARPTQGPMTTAPLFETVLRGRATYANLRRFRVDTDEALAPK